MGTYICDICGGTLVIGKGNEDVDWCPKCEGVEVIPKEESKSALIEELKMLDKEMDHIIKKYQLEDLLITVYVTRESVLHFDYPDFAHFMAYSALLNRILNLQSNGTEKVIWNSEDIQKLYRYAEMYNNASKFLLYLINGLIVFILVDKENVEKYSYEFDKSLKVEGIQPSDEKRKLKEIFPMLKFTATWRPIRDNLKQYGLVSKNEAYFDEDYNFKFLQFDDFWKSILTKTMLELWAGNKDLLEFPDFKDSLQYLKVWEHIANSFPFKQNETKDNIGRVIKFTMSPVDKTKIFDRFFKNGLDLEDAGRFLVDNNSKIKKGFPAFLQTSKGLFIGQSTTILFTRYLKGKYFRSYLDSNKDVGNEFVLMVSFELQRLGFSVHYPDNKDKLLINIMDDDKNPKLEIDVIAYTKEHIFLIECKHILLNTGFESTGRQNNVKRTLKDEPQKMKNRVNYIATHLIEFGLGQIKPEDIEPIFITFNQEPLDEYEGIRIVAFKNLQSLDYSVKNEKFVVNKRGAIVYENPFNHELLKIQKISNKNKERGNIYNVLSVGLIRNEVYMIPGVTIKNGKNLSFYRLPAQLLDWAVLCVRMSESGNKIFPSQVEFGYLVDENRIYAQIL